MSNPDFALDPNASPAEIDARLSALHVAHHHDPKAHIQVHLRWAREHLARRAYARAAFQLVAGLVFAGPASLVQRYTGLVAPAFDARKA